ncbi:Ig-like domain-containing protein [Sediminitomix flava]|uniref:Putative secreted protein (Por secretion system target) n=1 Tax=Sediminitomix flava TaxID=379075 RepID=A0A315ZEV4_SEDFL|nr:S8 family serine peptidase [Sediminitomix flava]PWJ43368.1 putative secreted protein (Por secretion system target) [Sediminitomix flava]
MKRKANIFFVLFMLLFSFTLQAQYRAEQINNVVRVKFAAQIESQIIASPMKSNSSQVLSVGLRNIDRLAAEYQIREMKRVFPYAGKFEEKHRKYGLHLWYDVSFSENVSVETVLNSFEGITEVTTCTPVFKYSTGDASVVQSPNDPSFGAQWHYDNTGQTGGTVGADIKLLEAWNVQTGDDRVVVSIHDSGIDYNHEDLSGNIWVNEGEIPNNGIDDDNNGYIDDVYGWDFHYGTNDVYDYHSHGTHVAGTVAAENNNGIGVGGVAGGTGIGDGIRLMAMSLNADGSNAIYNPAPSFIYAADMGSIISQNSWGGGSYDQSLVDAINYYTAEAGSDMMNGGIVIISSGNSDSPSVDYRSELDGVMMVSATTHNDTKSWYSNYGDWVDISAPGGETSISSEGVLSTVPNNGYAFFQGTSMACPHVSGVAALVVSEYGSPSFSPATLWDMLVNTTDPIDDVNPSYQGELGSGRLNAARALGEGNDDDDNGFEPAPRLAISPDFIYKEVDEGSSTTAVIKIINAGNVDTDFSLSLGDVDWASADVTSGVIAPGESQNVTVTLDATNYTGGFNPYVEAEITSSLVATEYVGVEMYVLGDAIVASSALDLENTFVGYAIEAYLEVENNGTNYYDITNVTSDNADIEILETSFEGIRWGQSVYIPITFNPSTAGDFTGNITIEGNASNLPMSVSVVSQVLSGDPASISVAPSPLSVQAEANEEGEVEVVVTNSGDTDFSYSLNITNVEPEEELAAKVNPYQYYRLEKKGENALLNAGQVNTSGYADEYSWEDNSNGNVLYDWVDISTSDVVVSGCDDCYGTYTLNNFDFPFYNEDYSTLYVTSNGLITFGTTGITAFGNVSIPNADTPNNFIAGLWDDLRVNYAYVQEQEDHVIIQCDVYPFGGGSSFEFQYILWDNGNIKIQYKDDPDTNAQDATIGVENQDGTLGLQIAYNTTFASAGKAILIKPDVRVFDLGQISGVVAANSTDAFDVLYSTVNLEGGETYERQLDFYVDGYNYPVQELPMSLTVGVYPTINFEEEYAILGDVYVDSLVTFPVSIINEGSTTLEINSITATDATIPTYTYPLTVEVGDTLEVMASITPTVAGDFYGVLEIDSNDPYNSVTTFEVYASAINTPVYSSSETSFDWTVSFGRGDEDTLTFSNTVAESLLGYSVSIEHDEEEELLHLPALLNLEVDIYSEDRSLHSVETRTVNAIELAISSEISGKTVALPPGYSLFDFSILAEDGALQGVTWVELNELTESSLSEVDLLLLYDNVGDFNTQTLSVIKDWIMSGGGLITMGDDSGSTTNINYLLEGSGLTYNAYGTYYDEYIYDFAPHPITNSLIELYASSAGAYFEVEGSAENIVFTQNGNAFVGVATYGGGRIIGIGNESLDDYNVSYSEDHRLFANQAIAWALGGKGSWLRVSPSGGELEGVESEDLVLTYNARGLDVDTTYTATLVMNTSDPNNTVVEYPVSLTVESAPLVSASTDQVYFFEAYTGVTSSGSFSLSNAGTESVAIASLDLPENVTVLDLTFPYELAAETELEVYFNYTPAVAGSVEDSFIVTFDGDVQEDIEIEFYANVIDAALLTVSPDYIYLNMRNGEAMDTTFTLHNEGTVDLNYTMSLVEASSMAEIEKSVASMQTRWNGLDIHTIERKGIDGSVEAVSADEQAPVYIQEGDSPGFNIAVLSTPLNGSIAVDQFDIVDSLLASDKFASVTTIDVSVFTPNWNELQVFDGIVLARGDYYFYDNYYLGMVLADYVDYRGSVVTMYPEVASNEISNYWSSYRLMGGNATYSYQDDYMMVQNTTHPIFAGVDTLGLSYDSFMSKSISTYNDPEILATWASGEPLVVTAQVNGVQRTDLNYTLYSTETDINGFGKGSQGGSLLANAIEWTILQNIGSEVEWLTASKYAGSAAAGGTDEIAISVDASELHEGSYLAYAMIRSNNIYPLYGYPIAVDIYGVPELEASNLDFGTHIIGYEVEQDIVISNIGDGSTDIEQVIVTGEFELVADYELSIPYQDSVELAIKYIPESEGAVTGELILISTEGEQYSFELSAMGSFPGHISFDPQELVYNVEYASSSTETLTINNTGEGELKFQFSNFYPEDLEYGDNPNNISYIQFAKDPVKGEVDSRQGHAVVNGYGFGDGGYFFMDNYEESPSAPIYNWMDISENENAVLLDLGDDDAAGVELPFEVSLFGHRFTKAYVSSNGYLTFDPNGANLPVNQQIPDVRTPNSIVAPLWKDLNPEAGGSVHYLIGEDVLYVQYTDVPSFAGDGEYTFQVMLTRGGNMLFQYEKVEGNAYNVSVGAENYDGSQGIQVAFNTYYIEEGLAVAIYASLEYIVPNITQGTIDAGGSMDVDVTVNSLDLLGGSYYGEIWVSSLDPEQPQSIVPLYLTVTGEPSIAISEDSLIFEDSVLVGDYAYETFEIYNEGSDTLHISEVTSTSENFTALFDGLVIPPMQMAYADVMFNPSDSVFFEDTLSIVSDVDTIVSLYVFGQGKLPNVILAVSPSEIIDSLEVDTQVSHTVTLTNNGTDSLIFDLEYLGVTPVEEQMEINIPAATAPSVSRSIAKTGKVEERRSSVPQKGVPTINMEEDLSTIALTGIYAYDVSSNPFHGTFELGNPEYISLENETSAPSFTSSAITLPGNMSFLELHSGGELYEYSLVEGQEGTLINTWLLGMGDWTGITIDPTSKAIYASTATALYELVDENGLYVAEYIGDYSETYLMISITATGDGELYGYDIVNDMLYGIDKATAQLTDIGYIGFDANFGQGMAWDPTTGIVWMSAFNYDTFLPELRVVDLNTGNTGLVGYLGDSAPGGSMQVSWLAFPSAGQSFVSASIEEGVIAPGDSQDVTLTLDASDMPNGTFESALVINSNDPVSSIFEVPVTLTVSGNEPFVVLSDYELDFGNPFIFDSPEATFSILNDGDAVLLIDSISTSSSVFSVVGYPMALEIGEEVELTVSLNPAEVGSLDETLTIFSNASDVSVSLIASVRTPDVYAVVLPGELESKQPTNEVRSEVITIRNLGESTSLEWDIEIADDSWLSLDTLNGSVDALGEERVRVSFNSEGLPKGSYGTELLLTTNDPNLPSTIIPVEFEVINSLPVVANPLDTVFVDLEEEYHFVDMSEVFTDADSEEVIIVYAEIENSWAATVMEVDSGFYVTPNAVDTTSVRVVALDPEDGLVETTVDLVIEYTGENDAPEFIGTLDDVELNYEGSPFISASLEAMFVDEDELFFEVTSSDEEVAEVEIVAGLLVVTPHHIGSAEILVSVSDPFGGVVEVMFTTTVIFDGENAAPMVATSIDDMDVDLYEGTYYLDISDVFTDEDYDRLTVSVESSDEAIAMVSLDGDELRISPQRIGDSEVTLTATDGKGGIATEVFNVTVIYTGVNSLPMVLEYPENQVISLAGGENLIGIFNVFYDYDGDELEMALEVSDSSKLVAELDFNNNYLAVSPLAGGVSTITLMANDGKSEEWVAVTFDIEVIDESNNLPEFVQLEQLEIIPNQEVVVYDLASVFTDADDDVLTFNVESSDELVIATISNDSLSINATAATDAEVTLVANDGRSRDVVMSFGVHANTAPSFVAIDTIILNEIPTYHVIDLHAHISDADGDDMTMVISEEMEGLSTYLDGGNLMLTIEDEVNGTVQIDVEDTRGGTLSASFVIITNHSPEGVAQELINLVPNVTTTAFKLEDLFTDVDADALVFDVSTTDSVLVANIDGDSLFVSSIAATDAEVIVTANDEKGGVTALELNVHSNTLPTSTNDLPNIATSEVPSVHTFDLSMYFEDIDGDELVYFAETEVSSLTLAFSGDLLMVMVNEIASGTVSITAEDGRGGSVEASFSLDVITSVDDVLEASVLKQNAPNPFTTSTSIEYSISEKTQVSLRLYSAQGQFVKEVVSEEALPGDYQVEVSKDGLQTGLYFYILTVGDKQFAKRMIVE